MRSGSVIIALGVAQLVTMAKGESIARMWNEPNPSAIRIDFPDPPVHACNLFHHSVAIYDAWARR